jgi:hypothetical protein
VPKNRVFRQTEIDAIVQTIRAWPKSTISWADVCKEATPILGFTPSRQGMNQREPILEAFQARKKHLRVSPMQALPMPSSLAVAARRIGILNAEISELKAMNTLLKDRLQIWQYNAHLKGMNDATLDKPLPSIDREIDKQRRTNQGGQNESNHGSKKRAPSRGRQPPEVHSIDSGTRSRRRLSIPIKSATNQLNRRLTNKSTTNTYTCSTRYQR